MEFDRHRDEVETEGRSRKKRERERHPVGPGGEVGNSEEMNGVRRREERIGASPLDDLSRRKYDVDEPFDAGRSEDHTRLAADVESPGPVMEHKRRKEHERERHHRAKGLDAEEQERERRKYSDRRTKGVPAEDGLEDDGKRKEGDGREAVRGQSKERSRRRSPVAEEPEVKRSKLDGQEQDRGRDHERERERHRDKDRGRDRDRDRDRGRHREKDRERDKERESKREKEREPGRERERERERRREDDRGRGSEREEERRRRTPEVREKERGRDRDRDKDDRVPESRKRDSERDGGDDEAERKRRRQEKIKERLAELRAGKEGSRGVEEDEERQRLEDEAEKRRKRVEQWQAKRREQGGADDMAAEAEAGEAAGKDKKWTLDGDSDDELHGMADEDDDGAKQQGPTPTTAAEEVDPLDAFMAAEVLPAVQKLEQGEADEAAKREDKQQADVKMEPETEDKPDFLPPLRAVKKEEDDPDQKPFIAQKTAGRGGLLPKKVGGIAFGMLRTQGPSRLGAGVANGVAGAKGKKGGLQLGRILPGEGSDDEAGSGESDAEVAGSDDDDDMLKTLKRASKVEKMGVVDHSKINYPPFRKDFYIEVKELARMTPAEVAEYRRELGDIKMRGKDVPKPLKAWTQAGLSAKVLDTIRKAGWERPMPIQAQALPVIMSGRDFIGIAKTGSGKTLAFVLPMLRHILDQPPLAPGDGPIAMIMAPTRELVQQIHADVRRFTRSLGLTVVAVYGGSGVADQIGALKRGAEIVVCTPGRMIDILCTGKVTNLRRVTYFVMDEADRMFDMGFEPQITRIIGNTRPDRQTVLFSATFPRSVEALARKVLAPRAVEVQIGGRSVVNKDIAQSVELRPEEQRFARLLELLGEWYERGKILVFVHSQEKADATFRELLKAGYPCLSLHGGKDQEDRESTLADFKADVCSLLVATSVAARGLDVKDLQLVVNMDVPNHYEDYVHRVGRTGRAGNKGTAITFISEDEERYAPDLVKALQLSEAAVPADLKALADGFLAKVKAGTEQTHGSGFGGSGFKFDAEEEEARKSVRKEQAREYGFEEEKSDSDGEDDDGGVVRKSGTLDDAAQRARQLAESAKAAEGAPVAGPSAEALAAAASNPALALAIATAQAKAAQIAAQHGLPVGQQPAQTLQQLTANLMANATDDASRAAAAQAAINLQETLAKIQAQVGGADTYEAEVEINDFPQHARWKATHKENLGQISDFTGVAITTRGQYFPPGKQPGPTDRKLYLFIEGPTESSVKKARQEIRKLLEAAVAGQSAQPIQPGKYFL